DRPRNQAQPCHRCARDRRDDQRTKISAKRLANVVVRLGQQAFRECLGLGPRSKAPADSFELLAQCRQMTSQRALETTAVLHPVQSLLVLSIVVTLGEEAVALYPARCIEHELIELHEAQRKSRRLRLGEDANTRVDLVDVALVHELELASQPRIAT